MSEEPTREPIVVVHHAATWTEAMVIRGLLESAGIDSPAPTSTDPFPLRKPPKGTHGVEILVLAPQADDARSIIADYRDGERGQELDDAPSDTPSGN